MKSSKESKIDKKLTKELLIDLYINQDKSIEEISNFVGMHKITISNWLKSMHLSKNSNIPSKEVLFDLYVNKQKTLSELESILQINKNRLSSLLNDYQIKIRIDNRDQPTKDVLIRLYNTEKFTTKQISVLYNIDESIIKEWFKSYSIPLKSIERKFYHLRGIPLTSEQESFIIGEILGKGKLSRVGKKKSTRLEISHDEKQLEYLLWKKEIISNYVNNVRQYIKKDSTIWSLTSINLDVLNFYYKLFYDNNKKVVRDDLIHHITELGMCIWYLDDGWRINSSTRISSEKFSKQENEILSRIIKVNFDIYAKVCEYQRNGIKYYYLSFNKENSIKLTNLIEKYVIPSMRYKLISSTTIRQGSERNMI